MNYRVLYRKYRPLDFDTVVGQNFARDLLKNSIKNNKISHAYIFTGPRGTGKTSSAKIFARAINCLNPRDGNPCNECEMCKNFNTNPDIIELDAASNNGVDEIREIINNVKLAPSTSKYKVYIIDEVHMLSTSAFNALLLTLEEPPSNVVFILATTDIQNVPITVLSRCQRIDFKLIDSKVIKSRLKYICGEENISISEDSLDEISSISNGGLRDALSILDQLSSSKNNIDVNDVIASFGGISKKRIEKFVKIYETNSVNDVVNEINCFKQDGIDAKLLIQNLISYFKDVLIKIKNNEYDGNLNFDNIYNLIFSLNSILTDIKYTANSYDLIIITLIKYLNYFPGNNLNANKDNLSNSKILEKNDNFEEKIKSISEVKSNIKFDINIRINNTFANAKKEFLNNIKSKWNDFIIYESNANKTLLSYIADTMVVAASDKYAILTNDVDSTNNLINENIESIEKDFKIFFNSNYKLVSISSKKWDIEKEKYVKNIKSGFNYSLIDDNIVIEENISELEKLATEIFGNNFEVK